MILVIVMLMIVKVTIMIRTNTNADTNSIANWLREALRIAPGHGPSLCT